MSKRILEPIEVWRYLAADRLIRPSWKSRMKHLFTLSMALLAGSALAQTYTTDVVLSGLKKPTGITVSGSGFVQTIFFSQLPTPGVSGAMGGQNTVDAYVVPFRRLFNLTKGEPEPTNLAFDRENLYWTCKSAGVVLARRNQTGKVTPFMTGLQKPSGIAVGTAGEVYFTQLPTPGVSGAMGGSNRVDVTFSGRRFNMTIGEPEPTDIASGPDGSTYWTCKSAGVILERSAIGVVSVLQSGLEKPTGISLDDEGRYLYWTEVPTPGVAGSAGGRNKVVRLDLLTNTKINVNVGDPEPTDVVVARDGTLYWTCTSAGVIVRARLRR